VQILLRRQARKEATSATPLSEPEALDNTTPRRATQDISEKIDMINCRGSGRFTPLKLSEEKCGDNHFTAL
jgi:hypothetical protein